MPGGLVPAGSQPDAAQWPAPSVANDQFTPAAPKNPLERPLAAARRYKWLIMAMVILAGGLGFVGTKFIQPRYEVRATLWVATEKPFNANGNALGPIRSTELLTSPAWVDLLKSFKITDAVVRKLALFLHPANSADAPLFSGFALEDRYAPGDYELSLDRVAKTWSLKLKAGGVVERGAAGDSVGRKVGFKWELPSNAFFGSGARTVAFHVATPRETSIEMVTNLNHRLTLGSNFLWLNYQDADAKRAALTLNTWIQEYVQVATELKRRNVVEFAKILKEQLDMSEKATQQAESAYQRFRVNTITLPAEGVPVAPGADGTEGDIALSSFFEQKIEHDNLRNDREALERTIATATASSTPYEGLLLIPSVAQSPGAQALRNAFNSQYQMQAELRVLRQSYTDEYAAVKDLKLNIDVVQKQTIPQLASQLLGQLKAREQDFERRIASASKELQAIPPRTIEERRLKRAVVVSEGLYTNLQGRYAEAQLAAASSNPDISIVDTAIAPVKPTTNTTPKILLMAVVGGLGAALGLALLLDTMDRRIRYAEQATSELGLAIAGAIPRAPKGGINASSSEQVVQFVESFRSLRMHVMHSMPGRRFAFAVTSAAPGDGKSLVSANLALSFAEAGLRTVLVDGDTRRGSLHKMFGLPGTGGLTDLLAGTVAANAVVRATTHDNLSFVSCGRRHPRSPELLASAHLRPFVQQLCQSFDVVIFDTPPLAAGIDGFAISAATGSIVMVLRMGQTERRLAAAKLAVLDRLPVRVLGAVLNGVPQTGEFEYYAYSRGYSVDGVESDPDLVASRTE